MGHFAGRVGWRGKQPPTQRYEPGRRLHVASMDTDAARSAQTAVRLEKTDALSCAEHAVNHRVQIGEPRKRIKTGVDAIELDLKLPVDDIGEPFIGLPNIAVGPEQRK